MNIKTKNKSCFGKKVLCNNTLVEFDIDGFAQVDPNVIDSLLETYSDLEKASNDDVDLKKMSLPELKDFCKEAGFEESEWSELKKGELIAYISEKLK